MAKLRNLPLQVVHTVIKDSACMDTIEIGTPGKGGVLKVHIPVDATYEESCAIIDGKVAALNYARQKVSQ